MISRKKVERICVNAAACSDEKIIKNYEDFILKTNNAAYIKLFLDKVLAADVNTALQYIKKNPKLCAQYERLFYLPDGDILLKDLPQMTILTGMKISALASKVMNTKEQYKSKKAAKQARVIN